MGFLFIRRKNSKITKLNETHKNRKNKKGECIMKLTKTIDNILDYSTDYEFFKYIHNFEVYFQPRVNTAINKQVFSEYIGKKLNEVEGLSVFFNPLTGDMSIHDNETGEAETKKFHQFDFWKSFYY